VPILAERRCSRNHVLDKSATCWINLHSTGVDDEVS
jgi:hypothetical protein